MTRAYGNKRMTVAALCVVFFAAAAGDAQNVNSTDKHFVREAIEGSNAEIQLGQLAQQKGSSQDVKDFGQKMIDDHTKMNDQMREVAGKVGVAPPSGTSMSSKAVSAKLQMLSGDTFDKAYISAMVKDHREDLKAFRQEASTTHDPAIKDAASHGAEIIEDHLHRIEQIAQSHNVKVD